MVFLGGNQMKKIFNVAIIVTLLVMAALVPATALAATSIRNGDFESNPTDGWTVSGPGSVTWANNDVYYTFDGAVIHPQHGSSFVVVYPSDSAPSVYTSIAQPFDAAAGNSVSGYAFFDAGPWSDPASYGQVLIQQGTIILKTFTVQSVGPGMHTGWTEWSYTFATAGTYSITARVTVASDGSQPPALGVDNVSVTAMATADAGGPYFVDEGGTVTLHGTGFDPNSGNITYDWDFNYSGSAFNVTNANSKNPLFSAEAIAGPAIRMVALRITTTQGLTALGVSTVTIRNVVPTVNCGQDAMVTDGAYFGNGGTFFHPGPASLTITKNFGDPTSADNVSVSTVPAPTNGSGTFELFHQYRLPVGVTAQNYNVTVTVDDGHGGVGTGLVHVGVISPANAPKIDPITGNLTVWETQTIKFDVVCEDPQQLPMNIKYEPLPAGAFATSLGGIVGTAKYKSSFTWQPALGSAGTYTPLITVTDTLLLSTTVNVVLIVKPGPPPAKRLTVNTQGTGTVSVAADQPANADGTYPMGTMISLTAVPVAGTSEFGSWTGDITATANPAPAFALNNDMTVTAVFTGLYNLTVNTSGSGSVSKTPAAGPYRQGSSVSLTATPAEGYVIDRWEGVTTSSGNTASVTMDSNKTVTAYFKLLTYRLTTSSDVNGTVSVSSSAPANADGSYNWGTTLTLTATPVNNQYVFNAWSGDLTGTVNPGTLVIKSDKSVTASFKASSYKLTVTSGANGTVTVTSSVPANADGSYNYGTTLTLTAAPANSQVTFDAWSGDLTGNANPATLVMNSNKSVTAGFKASSYRLTVNPAANGTINIASSVPANADGSYNFGTTVTLTAVPANTQFAFNTWSGDLTGTTSPATLVMNSDKSVTASFKAASYPLTVNTGANGTVNISSSAPANADGTYAYGTTITLTTVAGANATFSGWSGDLAGTTAPATIVMTGAKTVTAAFTLNTQSSTLVIDGALTADYHDAAIVSATLKGTAGTPVSGASIVLTLGTAPNSISITATTDANGKASGSITPNMAAGQQPLTAVFAGNAQNLACNASAVFNVTKEQNTLVVTSSAMLSAGQVTISAALKEDGVTPIASRTVTFTAGTKTATATTNASGIATAVLSLTSGQYAVAANFAGDGYYLPSTGAQTLTVYQGTNFVIWGGNTPNLADIQVGNTYYFWGSQWWKQCKAGDFDQSSSFKGWADEVAATTWKTRPGNSCDEPDSIGAYVAVMVSTKIDKSGSALTGNIVEWVVLKVNNPGSYQNNPGHEATGVLVGVASVLQAPPILTYTITASVGDNGTITPSGNVAVTSGGTAAFTIKADTGCTIDSVLVDGRSVGAVGTYTFANVTANHTIKATFDDPRDCKDGILKDLMTLRYKYQGKYDCDNIDDAIGHLRNSLTTSWWKDGKHLSDRDGINVFDEDDSCVNLLYKMKKDKKSSIDDDTLQNFIDRIVDSNARLTEVACNDNNGTARGDSARAEYNRGKDDASHGRYDTTVSRFKTAWKNLH